jgi:hypothetical protein
MYFLKDTIMSNELHRNALTFQNSYTEGSTYQPGRESSKNIEGLALMLTIPIVIAALVILWVLLARRRGKIQGSFETRSLTVLLD